MFNCTKNQNTPSWVKFHRVHLCEILSRGSRVTAIDQEVFPFYCEHRNIE